MSNNGGSALVLATPVDTLTLLATDNTITGCNDNGIAVISSTTYFNWQYNNQQQHHYRYWKRIKWNCYKPRFLNS